MNIFGRIRIGINVGGGPGRVTRPIVLIPGDGVVVLRGGHDIEITIAIHVGDVNIFGRIRIGINVGGGEARIRGAVVLVPGNGVVGLRGRNDVEIAIAVHVGHMNIFGTVCTGGDVGRGERE